MPIVCATSRVCKFHTCPIISPSIPPSVSPPLLCLLSFHLCSPPRSPTPRSEQLEEQKAAPSVLLRTCNRKQRNQQRERSGLTTLRASLRSLQRGGLRFTLYYRHFYDKMHEDWCLSSLVDRRRIGDEINSLCWNYTAMHLSASCLIWECFCCQIARIV